MLRLSSAGRLRASSSFASAQHASHHCGLHVSVPVVPATQHPTLLRTPPGTRQRGWHIPHPSSIHVPLPPPNGQASLAGRTLDRCLRVPSFCATLFDLCASSSSSVSLVTFFPRCRLSMSYPITSHPRHASAVGPNNANDTLRHADTRLHRPITDHRHGWLGKIGSVIQTGSSLLLSSPTYYVHTVPSSQPSSQVPADKDPLSSRRDEIARRKGRDPQGSSASPLPCHAQKHSSRVSALAATLGGSGFGEQQSVF